MRYKNTGLHWKKMEENQNLIIWRAIVARHIIYGVRCLKNIFLRM